MLFTEATCAFVHPPWAEVHRVYFTKERQATERREKSMPGGATEVEAVEAVMVSTVAASGRITRRREGDEDGDTERDHLSLHPPQPSLNPSNHIEPNANHMCKSINVPTPVLVAYTNKNLFV